MCLAYLDEYAARSQAVVQGRGFRRILPPQLSDALFALLREGPADFRPRLVALLARAAMQPAQRGQGRLYLNIGHTGLDRPAFADWLAASDVRPIYFVHDVIPITHPQFCRAGEQDKHKRRMLTVLDTAAGVIGNSQATIDELSAFATAEGRSMPPAIAGWLGSDQPAVRAAPSDKPTFVAVSTIEARKNHVLLLDVWGKLAETSGDDCPQLLLIGQRGWEAQEVFDRLANDQRLRGKVTELNQCSDAEMFEHLARARAVLFPSLAEGFGLPLVEALAVGTPGIVSDLPVFREIGQGIPELLDPLEIDSWVAAVAAYADLDSPRRKAQIGRLSAFRLFTWRDHFAAIGPWLGKL